MTTTMESCEEDQPDEEETSDNGTKASCVVAQHGWCDVCAERLVVVLVALESGVTLT